MNDLATWLRPSPTVHVGTCDFCSASLLVLVISDEILTVLSEQTRVLVRCCTGLCCTSQRRRPSFYEAESALSSKCQASLELLVIVS